MNFIYELQQFMRYNGEVMYFLIILPIFIFIIASIFRRLMKAYHSHWNVLLDGFSFSTQEFYSLLKSELQQRKIEPIGTFTIHLNEFNLFSRRRMYFRVVYRKLQFDVCMAPFGRGMFVSWWLLYRNSVGMWLISRVPIVGKHLVKILYPVTYYQIDTASMFMTSAHAAVLAVIDRITEEKGIRLTEQQRTPKLNDIDKR